MQYVPAIPDNCRLTPCASYDGCTLYVVPFPAFDTCYMSGHGRVVEYQAPNLPPLVANRHEYHKVAATWCKFPPRRDQHGNYRS